ncbi:MAG: helix-turn-helix transcriptional regulator [Bacteroidales bacterium]|nr:helix-turn-helix transcriptional regulator [Bacteroidales bacterium]
MKYQALILAAVILSAGCSRPQTGWHPLSGPDGTQWQPMGVERLPDLNVPRGCHRTLVLNGEITLLGGNTTGFKPIETAEYYADGAWHTVSMLYSHMNGFAASLPDGSVLLGGGSPEAFGIGQSWGMEIYDPASHSFSASGIMSVKRAMSSALTMPDGSVLIVGNWRAGDSFETWTPDGGFVTGEALAPGWAEPFIFPASEEDIIVFGAWDTRGNRPGGRVDHIWGQTESDPLLEDCLLPANYCVLPEEHRIADYTYLVPVLYKENMPAILRVDSGRFSLLETEPPLPLDSPDGGQLDWGHLQVDRHARLAWVQGFDSVSGMLCFARIDYNPTLDGGKASATFYYAEQPGGFPAGCAKMLSGGRFVLAGGTGWEQGTCPVVQDFFNTYQSAYILHTEQPQKTGVPLWVIILAALLIAGVIILMLRLLPRKQPVQAEESRLTGNLMEQISTLIEEKELWRRKDLRITDLASELATNKTYVSLLLNNVSGGSFTDIVNGYRVRNSQTLMREHPEMLLDDVAAESGFSSYTSFYRNFKSITGMTPQEWKKLGE